MIRRRETVRGVLDDPEAVLRGERLDLAHVHHQPADMHGNDADHAEPRLQRRLAGVKLFDLPLGVGKVHVQRHGIAIDQQRNGPLIADHFGGRGEGHRRHEHGLSGREPQRLDGQVQRGGAGVHGHGKPPAAFVPAEVLLEAGDLRAHNAAREYRRPEPPPPHAHFI